MTHLRHAAAMLLLVARPLSAQVQTRDTTSLPEPKPDIRERALCAGQRVSDIVIVTQPPFTEKLPRGLEFVRGMARALHANTRDGLVRRYLLLEVGDACVEQRRAESERILRAQPFLVDARITTFDDGAGGVRLEVETRDEFSLLLAPHLSLDQPRVRGLRMGESNLAGAGIDASVVWRKSISFDDVIGLRLIDYQFLGQRNELRIDAMRFEHGNNYQLELVKPYYTDLQRFAWRASMGGNTEHHEFVRPDLPSNALVADRRYASVGAITRVGTMRRLKLVGLSFSREHQRTGDEPFLITDTAILPDTMGFAPTEFQRQDVARLNLLAGMRRLRFERVQGFDALTGAQDVRIGVQVGMLAGRSVHVFGGQDNDKFLATDVYAGYGGQRSFVGMQMIAEGRRDVPRSAWENVLTSGRIAWYLRPAARQLTLTQLEWGSGSGVGVPFQLTMNDHDGGMIGYHDSRVPGAQRLVLRAEQRMVLPSIRNVADGGVALFADVGRLWRGEAAYGVTTPWRGTAGVSLQAAIPPRSRRLWRIDFGFPFGGDPDAKFEIRFSNSDRSRQFWMQPRDLTRARERTVPTSIFSWP